MKTTIIDKIINKYFTKKCIQYIEHIFAEWNLDYKFEKDATGYNIYVKKKKYKDYTYIYCINYKGALDRLLYLDETERYISKTIQLYLEEEKK